MPILASTMLDGFPTAVQSKCVLHSGKELIVLQTLGCLTFIDCSKPQPNEACFVFNTPRDKFSPQLHVLVAFIMITQPST